MDTVLLPPTCPACGAAIPADAPQGLCPRCALGGAAAPTDMAPARGEPPPLDSVRAAFPQLEILELLGAGGMGFVFQARQPHLDRLVALKLLPIPLAADPHFSERFLREGRLLARLTHPGIVTVYDFGQAGGFAYLLMEYVDGVNLRQAMAAGRFTPAEALAVVPKICEALQYAHGRGVLHRDIKPENLLLDAQGRVKIADFGIAKLVGDPARGGTLTGSGARLGTPHYMAPEQVESPGDVDHRADIYSLGVVFYEMLTGELPLGRFAPPSQKTPLDARVDEIVMRALAKERELRQQSAGEVQTQVEGLATAEGRAPASPGGEAPGATGSLANVAVPVLPARASRLAGWAVVGMALPLSILAVVALAGVWPDPSWNPGREELLVTLALWIGTPVTLLSGAGLLRHGRTARTEISRGAAAAAEGLGFVAGLLCVGALFALSPHPAGLLAILVPPLAGLILLIASGWHSGSAGWGHRPAAARPVPASEYRSPRTLWGLPLLHIVRGTDPATGRAREARGIVAIGGHATGVLAIGGLARGVFAFGGVAFGLFAFGGLAFGGAAVGGLALGLFSFGGLAVGLILALGGLAVGWSAFGGLVVAQHGIGGFIAAGQRLPDRGLAGAMIRWLPWLWIPVLPLSLLPGLVAAWAYRKLEPTAAGPRPSPWPHRLFWLVVLLVAVPTLAPMLMLLVPILHARAGGQVAALVIGSLLVLLGCGLWLGYRATRSRLGEPALPANWNPWPKRVFLAVLAVGVLPLMLLVIALLLPRLAMRTNTAEQAERALRAAAADVGGLPENLPAGEPSPAAMKWHHAWKRLREAEAKASVGVVSPGGTEMLAAERDLAVAESEFKQQPGISARARLVYAEAILAITERMFANGRATEAEVDAARLAVAEAKAEASLAVTAAEQVFVARMLGQPVPASLRNVRYFTDEAIAAEPKYLLRFRAGRDEVLALLARGGFAEEADRAFNHEEGPAWWRSAPRVGLVHHARDNKPAGCVVEALWWDRNEGDVYYLRSCP